MNKLLTPLFALAVACVTGIASAQAPAPAAASADDAQSLQSKIAMCIGCHGIKGYQASFPEVYRVPMISGQSAQYIAASLNAYKQGERRHPTMRAIAQSLSEQDINAISSYYAAHGSEGANGAPVAEKPSREPSPRIAALLQKAACISCHGANFSKPIAPNYPKIGGQHKDYLFVALKAYKMDNNPTAGRNNAVMSAIAKQYSNAELKALAEYVSSLDGELKTIPEAKFR